MTETATTTNTAADKTHWTPMIFIGLGTALIIMDATIVNVSLPSIIRELGITSVDAEWVNAIYSLVFAALLIVAGRLGDRVGRRLMFVSGAVVFGVASVIAARTGDGQALIAARALQGAAGALLVPSSLAIISSSFHPDDRARAVGAWSGLGARPPPHGALDSGRRARAAAPRQPPAEDRLPP